ncbi:MAG: STAS domain-containing protein [Phycisphaerae bacterium]|nr:STAS domain-containing protein [Phycisphaerae bacterium]
MSELTVRTEKRAGGAVLTIAGAVSYDDARTLETEIAQVVEAKPGVVAVDLSGLSFISSVGIAALVTLHRGLHATGGAARIVGPSTNVFGVLEKAHLVELMPVFPTIELALTRKP